MGNNEVVRKRQSEMELPRAVWLSLKTKTLISPIVALFVGTTFGLEAASATLLSLGALSILTAKISVNALDDISDYPEDKRNIQSANPVAREYISVQQQAILYLGALGVALGTAIATKQLAFAVLMFVVYGIIALLYMLPNGVVPHESILGNLFYVVGYLVAPFLGGTLLVRGLDVAGIYWAVMLTGLGLLELPRERAAPRAYLYGLLWSLFGAAGLLVLLALASSDYSTLHLVGPLALAALAVALFVLRLFGSKARSFVDKQSVYGVILVLLLILVFRLYV